MSAPLAGAPNGPHAVTDLLLLRIVRPYDTRAEYLAAEAETIEKRGMLLVDAEPLPPGTLVRLSVRLAGGETVIEAEARVRHHRAPRDGRPGGLLVQFKRYGAATKSFIDAAVARRGSTAEEGDEDSSPGANAAPLAAAVEEVAPAEPATLGATRVRAVEQRPRGPAPPRSVRSARSTLDEVPPPTNREALLEELRERARSLSPDQVARLTAPADRV